MWPCPAVQHSTPRHELIVVFSRHRAAALAFLGKDAREIVEQGGFATLLKLSEARGGERVRVSTIPARAKDTALAKVVGVAQAAELIKLFRGDRIIVPTVGRLMAIYRKLRGRELLASGIGYSAIARQLGLSYGMIEKMAARARIEAA